MMLKIREKLIIVLILLMISPQVFSQKNSNRIKHKAYFTFIKKVEVSSNSDFGLNTSIGVQRDSDYSFVLLGLVAGIEVNLSANQQVISPKVSLEMFFESDSFFSRLPMYMGRISYSLPNDINSRFQSQMLTLEVGLSLGPILYLTGGYNIPLVRESEFELEGFRMSLGINF